MLIFLKLCLAHLIADFILQFDELFQLKLKSIVGHFLHAFCHAAVSLLLLWPYLGDLFIWKFVLSICAIHFFQDLIKYRLMEKHKKHFFLVFTMDQAIHFLFLSTLFLFPEGNQVLGFASHPILNELYIENSWTLYAIAFVTTSFAGSFTLYAFRINFLADSRPDHFITSAEIIHGLVERSVVTWLFIFAPNSWPLIFSPAIGLIRPFFRRISNKTDFFMSFNYAAMVGMMFRLFLPK